MARTWVDAVGAVRREATRLGEHGGRRQPRRVVDLGDDLDVEAAVVRPVTRLLAEEFVEAAEVLRSAFHRHVGGAREAVERPAAAARDDHPVGPRRHVDPLRDPGRRHQGRDRDVERLNRVVEAHAGPEPLQHLSQRVLGEAAGDEVDAGSRGGHAENPGPTDDRSLSSNTQ